MKKVGILKRIWRYFFPYKFTVWEDFPEDGKWRHLVIQFNCTLPEPSVSVWINDKMTDELMVWREGRHVKVLVHEREIEQMRKLTCECGGVYKRVGSRSRRYECRECGIEIKVTKLGKKK